MVEMTTGNVVMSKVDALMYDIVIKVEKHVPYEELAGTRECIMLYPRCRTK
jgi:hypothetical protein